MDIQSDMGQLDQQLPYVKKVEDITEKQQSKLPNTKTIYIEIESIDERRSYTGEFTFKRLNLGEQSAMAREIALRNGNNSIAPQAAFMNVMLVTCAFSVVKRPDWFNEPDRLFDLSIVAAIYKEVMAFEASFRRSAQ